LRASTHATFELKKDRLAWSKWLLKDTFDLSPTLPSDKGRVSEEHFLTNSIAPV